MEHSETNGGNFDDETWTEVAQWVGREWALRWQIFACRARLWWARIAGQVDAGVLATVERLSSLRVMAAILKPKNPASVKTVLATRAVAEIDGRECRLPTEDEYYFK